MKSPAVSPSIAPTQAGFAKQQWLWALAGGAPAWGLASFFIWQQSWLIYPKILLWLLCSGAWLGAAWGLARRAEFQQQTIGNVVEGIASGDYSQRLRRASANDQLGEQINALVDTLHRQRLRAEEAHNLVESVLQSIDVAIFAFDEQAYLRLANPAALALLHDSQQVLGRSAAELGLAALLTADTAVLSEHVFAGAAGLWRLRRLPYSVDGREQTLLFVTDLKQVLRSEELQAWRRLLRVLSHEVNNSLLPISSLSATLHSNLARGGTADLEEGLAIIHERAKHLAEFVRRYARLARLPEPQKQLFDLAALLRRLPAMLPEAALSLTLSGDSHQAMPSDFKLPFFGDPVQIEQLLINLLKNGVEAGGAPLELRCQAQPLQLTVLDCGPGIANPANLFVPFYTTKAEGAGIGLVLSRQIAEAHQGSLSLEPRRDGAGQGCAAILRFSAIGLGEH
ncbi:sensor histidine kinase [Roseateles oligotrophus]|uniref:histidine kinase n=1 Tax=Roseateles oligotrophus TaxID=1769250 RepID=A0ABT2YLK1_9BURK|nr:sensor histidine kinase [Roseateles oligotrophus]MCV2370954.1 sensor histidine kinase [Roseateles oligotrophus]